MVPLVVGVDSVGTRDIKIEITLLDPSRNNREEKGRGPGTLANFVVDLLIVK